MLSSKKIKLSLFSNLRFISNDDKGDISLFILKNLDKREMKNMLLEITDSVYVKIALTCEDIK